MNRISGIFAPSLILGMLLAGLFGVGCSKKDDGKAGAGADSALALPDQPPLPPVDDAFQEPDSTPAATGTPLNPRYGQVAQGAYVIQVRLFSKKSVAVHYAEKLKKLGIPAYVSTVLDPRPDLSGTYYRVRAGSFAATATAREYIRINLVPLGVSDAWVDLKARDSEPVHQIFTPRPQEAPAPVAQPVAPPAPAPVPVAPPAPPAPAPQPVAPPVVPPPPAPTPAPVDTPRVEDW